MKFLFPVNPLCPNKPDDNWLELFNLSKQNKFDCSLFSNESMEIRPTPKSGEEFVYFGWMLTVEQYKKLETTFHQHGSKLITSSQQYQNTHWLPNWYGLLSEFTPETVYTSDPNGIDFLLEDKRWEKFFVKDYVKSLTTSRGSVANNIEEINEIIKELKKFRGKLEGGVCVREFENLEHEQRFFIKNGIPYGKGNQGHPQILYDIAKRIDSPFYSVDLAVNVSKRQWRLVEIGDGQVSEPKNWELENFIRIFFHP